MVDDVYTVRDPYFVMFRNEQDRLECHIGAPEEGVGVELYGTLVADLVRHIALAHGVDVGEVMRHVIAEFESPTCTITRKLDA